MDIKRETFLMSEIKNEEINNLFHGEDVYLDEDDKILEYEYIDEDVCYTDYGKGYSDMSLIFKRCFDNKYFKVYFTAFSDGVYENLNELEACEVFPKTITINIYE